MGGNILVSNNQIKVVVVVWLLIISMLTLITVRNYVEANKIKDAFLEYENQLRLELLIENTSQGKSDSDLTDVDIEELVNSIDVQGIISSHPLFQPQAVADSKAIDLYYQDNKEYNRVYNEINTEWWDIKKQMDVFKMSDDEFNRLSEIEKQNLAMKYVQLQHQWDQNRKKLRLHKSNKPIRPDDAFKRIEDIQNIMSTTIDMNSK
jgi:hypothetical protein